MSKRIPVYLSEKELSYLAAGLSRLKDELSIDSEEYAISEDLEERLEAELETFSED